MLEALIYGSVIMSAGSAGVLVYPALARVWARLTGKLQQYQQVRFEEASRVLDDIFLDVKPLWLRVAYAIGPIGAGLIAYIITNNLIITLLAAVLGAVLPDLWVRFTKAKRRQKFQAQLVDSLLIISSSLKAGLSLPQAFEAVETEMNPPASQEFGLMMKAYRLGLTFEEALQGLGRRMPSEDLKLITIAMLVGRETGGDITKNIDQLVATIRQRKKLKDQVKTLTLQGRLQAYVMSLLPLFFAAAVHTVQPGYFDLLFTDPTGQMLLVVAAVLWIVGMVLLIKLSKVRF
jgi:tight adherence protein B